MGGCSAVNCSNHSRKNHRLFKFPSDPERRKIWAINCRRDAWVLGPNAQLCSAHFEESQYEKNRADKWKKLKQTAIPTLFNVPNPPAAIGPLKIKEIRKPKPRPILGFRMNDKPQESEDSLKQKIADLEAENKRLRDQVNRSPIVQPKVSQRYIITVDPKQCLPTTSYVPTNNISSNCFILPTPPTPILLVQNPVLPQLNCLSADIKNEKTEDLELVNKEQPTHEPKEADDNYVPLEPEVIIKVENDASSSSLEETENLNKIVNDSANSSCSTNDFESSSEKILKQKLEQMTALYEKTRKKLKHSQEQCNHYAKQVIALEKVIDNLRQINSVSDFV